MLLDARQLPDGHQLATDICIIGGGPAGITIARELSRRHDVCLVESGGVGPDPATQRLYRGENTGHVYFALDTCRIRYLGGSSNKWGGWSRPLDPIDYQQRAWVSDSGWPLGFDDMEPYFRRAEALCELTSPAYDGDSWASQAGYGPLPLPRAEFLPEIFQFSPPTLFGKKYHDDLAGAARLTTLLHGNVVELEVDPAGDAILGAQLRTLDGRAQRITARHYVLAAGGLENPRLLLASNRVRSAGLGNGHDLVGRYFMEHPHLATGYFLPSSPSHDNRFFEKRPVGQAVVKGVMVPSAALAEREGLMGISISPEPPEYSVGDLFNGLPRPVVLAMTRLHRLSQETPAWTVVQKTTGLIHRLRGHSRSANFDRDLQRVLQAIDQPLPARVPPRPGASYRLYCRSEQAPNRDSRVTLTRDRDALGVPRIRLDWRLLPIDLHTIQTCVARFASALGRAGLGRVKLPNDWYDDSWVDRVVGGPHHMGTTRMADAPSAGVVDRDCRVHGVSNLYLAGSSVFPTSGYANPTLTLVALAARLADHLDRQTP